MCSCSVLGLWNQKYCMKSNNTGGNFVDRKFNSPPRAAAYRSRANHDTFGDWYITDFWGVWDLQFLSTNERTASCSYRRHIVPGENTLFPGRFRGARTFEHLRFLSCLVVVEQSRAEPNWAAIRLWLILLMSAPSRGRHREEELSDKHPGYILNFPPPLRQLRRKASVALWIPVDHANISSPLTEFTCSHELEMKRRRSVLSPMTESRTAREDAWMDNPQTLTAAWINSLQMEWP